MIDVTTRRLYTAICLNQMKARNMRWGCGVCWVERLLVKKGELVLGELLGEVDVKFGGYRVSFVIFLFPLPKHCKTVENAVISVMSLSLSISFLSCHTTLSSHIPRYYHETTQTPTSICWVPGKAYSLQLVCPSRPGHFSGWSVWCSL